MDAEKKHMKKYAKSQIIEAIAYWKKQLKRMNESISDTPWTMDQIADELKTFIIENPYDVTSLKDVLLYACEKNDAKGDIDFSRSTFQTIRAVNIQKDVIAFNAGSSYPTSLEALCDALETSSAGTFRRHKSITLNGRDIGNCIVDIVWKQTSYGVSCIFIYDSDEASIIAKANNRKKADLFEGDDRFQDAADLF